MILCQHTPNVDLHIDLSLRSLNSYSPQDSPNTTTRRLLLRNGYLLRRHRSSLLHRLRHRRLTLLDTSMPVLRTNTLGPLPNPLHRYRWHMLCLGNMTHCNLHSFGHPLLPDTRQSVSTHCHTRWHCHLLNTLSCPDNTDNSTESLIRLRRPQ